MKNLIHIAAILFTTLLAMTSCQKDDMNDFNQLDAVHQTERVMTNTKSINESALTYATVETIENMTTERATHIEVISCSSETIYGDTRGSTSTFNANNSPCVAADGDSFRGDDHIFYFIVQEQNNAVITHNFVLKDLNDDLDLFLYTLTPQGRVNECKASSITIGLDNETIEVTGLNAGAYILVIDGWMEQVASTYTLDVFCTAVSSQPPTISMIDLIETISFGTKYADGSSSDMGKLYLDGEQWKEHIWGLPHFDTFENDALLNEYERGDNYLILQETNGRYFEIQLEEEKIYVYDSGFNGLEVYDILSING